MKTVRARVLTFAAVVVVFGWFGVRTARAQCNTSLGCCYNYCQFGGTCSDPWTKWCQYEDCGMIYLFPPGDCDAPLGNHTMTCVLPEVRCMNVFCPLSWSWNCLWGP